MHDYTEARAAGEVADRCLLVLLTVALFAGCVAAAILL